MMRLALRLALYAAVAMLCVPAWGWAGERRGPECGDAAVLRLVAEHLSRAGQPTWLEAGTVGQTSVGTSRVTCAVRVHKTVFDTPRYGRRPLDVVTDYRYALELRANGIFVQLPD